jgi:hypothetical protein
VLSGPSDMVYSNSRVIVDEALLYSRILRSSRVVEASFGTSLEQVRPPLQWHGPLLLEGPPSVEKRRGRCSCPNPRRISSGKVRT